MQIPEEIRKCVVFVCYKSKDEMQLAGTGFFVGVPLDVKGTVLNYIYLITARHIIDAIEERSSDKTVYLRMNLNDGGATFVGKRLDEWRFHPKESNADVAVLSWAPPRKTFDLRYIGTEIAVTEDIINKENIGVGDDVFLVGLFVNHFGSKKNLPIIRVGNIASMPEEKVYTNYGGIDAYLVEARSVGGLSGSPVFAYIGPMRRIGGDTRLGREGPLLYWLGLMHGHFELSELELDSLGEDSLTNMKINTGIAIVVPTWKILEVINQEVFLKEREELIEKATKGSEGDDVLDKIKETRFIINGGNSRGN
jgi:hypothetical protein